MEGALYIVATPIGNLGDMSQRALETLRAVELVAAEDTRHTRRLLDYFSINARLLSMHDHNERDRVDFILNKISSEGLSVAVVSDAGTPLISDPGFLLVRTARERKISVVPIPGPCAITAALSAGGISCDRFVFEGFLPAKTKARRESLLQQAEEVRTVVFYESTHRILGTLEMLVDLFPERQVVLAREITKKFETFLSGMPAELLAWLKATPEQQKGEFVLILAGAEEREQKGVSTEAKSMLARLMKELPPKRAVSVVVDLLGGDKKELYQYGLSLKG